MKLIFVDEINGNNEIDKNLYGLSIVMIDSTKYDTIREKFLKSLKKKKWPIEEEFKGKYLFSKNPAGQTKTPDEMIELTQEILGWLTSETNTRGCVKFIYNRKKNSADNFITLLSKGLSSFPNCTVKKNAKHLVNVYVDNFQHSDKEKKQIDLAADEILEEKGFKLIESSVNFVNSNNKSTGIIYADVLAYICRWKVENPDVKNSTIIDLIENYTLNKKIGTACNLYDALKNTSIVDADNQKPQRAPKRK